MSEEVRNGLMKQRRKAREKNKELQQENQQLKSVLNEVSEEIKDLLEHWKGNDLVERDLNILLTILDKVGVSNE